jgi:hypothetical protein
VSRIKLVAVDLDGTLLTNGGELTARTIESVRQCREQNVRIVIATTRTPSFVKGICNQLSLNDPVICSTGAEVLAAPEGPVWVCHEIPLSTARAIAAFADAHGWYLSTTVGSHYYWRQRPGQELGAYAANITIVPSNITGVVGEPVRMLAWEPEAIVGIRDLCQQRFPDTCRTEIFYDLEGVARSIVIVAPHADKGTALRLVLNRLGIDPAHVMAIGDNNNDLPMFKVAGTAVAMGNALDTIKHQADIVAPDNDHDGAAWALARYVLAGR